VGIGQKAGNPTQALADPRLYSQEGGLATDRSLPVLSSSVNNPYTLSATRAFQSFCLSVALQPIDFVRANRRRMALCVPHIVQTLQLTRERTKMIEAIENIIALSADPKIGESCSHARRTMIKNNKRASQRFKAKPGSNVFFVEWVWAIRDMSMDGVFILDAKPLAVGTHVTFSSCLGKETATFHGIVRRSVAQEGMGIQFQETPREIRRRLLSQIAC
jgi:hypothetical protein